MQCPKCAHDQTFDGDECERCGIIFARYRPATLTGDSRSGPASAHPEAEAEACSSESSPAGTEAAICNIGRAGWVAAGAGLVLAILTQLVTILEILIGHFVVLVHEFGHAVFGWLFGYPSIPAFDFSYGGGVTSHQQQSLSITILFYAAATALAWAFRTNRLSLALIVGLTCVYSLLLFSPAHEGVILAMGHGAELGFAALFLYRAFTGRACHHAVERAAYAWIGFHIVIHDALFAHGLATSALAREIYGDAKGGGHWMDFSRLAGEFLQVPLAYVAATFLALCALPPLIALAAALGRAQLSELRGRLGRV